MPLPWKRILCPVDFSDPVEVILKTAVELVEHFGSELLLFHAYELPGYTLPEGSIVASPRMLQDLADRVDVHLAEWKRKAESLGAVNVATAKSIGEPASRIVDFAREGSFDVIVMGTHGRTGVRHALLGSVAERVVRHSRCPVLVVHPEAKEEK